MHCWNFYSDLLYFILKCIFESGSLGKKTKVSESEKKLIKEAKGDLAVLIPLECFHPSQIITHIHKIWP